MAKKAEYGNESIVTLKGADRVRKRPAVIFGDDGLEGGQHSVFEIISNSIDEAREGYGNRIVVTRFLDGSVEVQDFGRGMPVDFNQKENRYNWELLFCEMYAGSKYNNNDGGSYEFALGLNGLGLCSTQYASEYMDAEIHTDGFCYTLHFEKGENIGGLKKEPYDKKDTGTRIRWKPDLEVFTDIAIPLDFFQNIMKKQAVVNNGVRFILKNQLTESRFETYEYRYDNGIVDYLTEIVDNKAITPVQYWSCERSGRDREDKPEYKVKIFVSLAFSDKLSMKEYYHNSSYLEHGGSPEKAVRAAFTFAVDKYLKAQNKYNKNESKVTFQDIADCLVLVTNSMSTLVSYANQTKKAITNSFIAEAMTATIKENLDRYFTERPLEAERFAAQVLINKRSRETAEKSRIDYKSKVTVKNDLASRVDKFIPCRSKDPSRRELFIVEGDSAMGSVKLARNAEFQAVIPIRGKTLNCVKSSYDKIFKSEVITNLLKVVGCGVEIKTKKGDKQAPFSMDDLKWSKIIICTDADVDGYHIRPLVLTMFYRLLPTLLKEGRVYIAESPLYEITCGKDTFFAYNEPEKADIIAGFGDKKYTIQRSKGLGENEPEMMSLTTMDPATRRLIRVTPADAEATAQMFETLMGDDLAGRKDYIALHGSEYLAMADI